MKNSMIKTLHVLIVHAIVESSNKQRYTDFTCSEYVLTCYILTQSINPAKAFLLESYEAMDLADPVPLADKCAITPSDWANLALRDKYAQVQTSGSISLRPEVSFGKPLPIRLS